MFTNRIVKLLVAGSLLTAFAFFVRDTIAKASSVTETKSVVTFGHALELQYAQPWIQSATKPVTRFSNTLELQYAQPWLQASEKSIVRFGNALELQYAQPWLQSADTVSDTMVSLDCQSNLETFSACQRSPIP